MGTVMEISFNRNDKFIATGSLFFERGYTFTAFFGLVFWNFTGGGGSYVRPPSPLLIPPILCNSEFNLDINIYAESKTLILWWLAGLLRVNEVMRSCWMNAFKNKALYHFCRVESLLSYHKHRTKHNNTLKADAYIWWKVKVSKNTLGATFLYVWLVWGVVERLRLCQKLWYFLKVQNIVS